MSVSDLSARLRSKFAAETNKDLNIVFWYDPEGGYQDVLDSLELDKVTVLTWDDSNGFALKCRLNAERTGKFLIYARHSHPLQREDHSHDLLLDLELGNPSFKADLYAAWLEELRLEPRPELRKFLSEHKRFFKDDANRGSLLTMLDDRLRQKAIRDVRWLGYVALSVCCQAFTPNRRVVEIASHVLIQGIDPESNKLWKKLAAYGLQKFFWSVMEEKCGYRDTDPTLFSLALHFMCQAAYDQAPSLAQGRPILDVKQRKWCSEICLSWQNGDKPGYKSFALDAGLQGNVNWNWRDLPEEELLKITIWPGAEAEVLSRQLQDICDNAIQPQLWKDIRTKRERSHSAWFEDYRIFYEVLACATELYSFQQDYHDGFHIPSAGKLWNLYCQDYYRFDSSYRHFQLCWEQAHFINVPEKESLLDLTNEVKQRIDNLCTNWFLNELSENWNRVALNGLRTLGTVEGVDRQSTFFSKWGARAPGEKSVVIISDALRYEVAVELKQVISAFDPWVKCKLESCCAVFPTITKMGMAALLPHNRLSVTKVKDGFEVLADGRSTASTNRLDVLRARNSNSVVLKYDEVIRSKSGELRERLAGQEIVYIYHDTIDSCAHGDKNVGTVCADAIKELSNLVKRLRGANVRNLVITSDHGFLYTDTTLREVDKLECDCRDQALEVGARYLVLPAGSNPEQLAEIRLLDGDTPFRAWATKELLRLKIKGQGGKYVHGGMSLQELVVPVLSYNVVRSDSKAYADNPDGFDVHPVKVILSSEILPVNNSLFSLGFFQQEPVGNAAQPQEYAVWFSDDTGKRVCEPRIIKADSTDTDPTGRVYRVLFELFSGDYSKPSKRYPLWMAPAEDMNNILQGVISSRAIKCGEFSIYLPFSGSDDGF